MNVVFDPATLKDHPAGLPAESRTVMACDGLTSGGRSSSTPGLSSTLRSSRCARHATLTNGCGAALCVRPRLRP